MSLQDVPDVLLTERDPEVEPDVIAKRGEAAALVGPSLPRVEDCLDLRGRGVSGGGEVVGRRDLRSLAAQPVPQRRQGHADHLGEGLGPDVSVRVPQVEHEEVEALAVGAARRDPADRTGVIEQEGHYGAVELGEIGRRLAWWRGRPARRTQQIRQDRLDGGLDLVGRRAGRARRLQDGGASGGRQLEVLQDGNRGQQEARGERRG